jgi:hypothetical protein
MKAIHGQRYLFNENDNTVLILEAKGVRTFEIIQRIIVECTCCLNEGENFKYNAFEEKYYKLLSNQSKPQEIK